MDANSSVEFDEYHPGDLFTTLASNLEANGSADFDEFTTDKLFKDAMQDDPPLDDLFYDDDPDTATFWLQDSDYYHNETAKLLVPRTRAARISGTPSSIPRLATSYAGKTAYARQTQTFATQTMTQLTRRLGMI